VTTDPSGATWRCTCKGEQHCNMSEFSGGQMPWFGRVRVRERYPSGPAGCPSGLEECPWTTWKYETSKLIGGLWYSTPANGNCDNPDAKYCTWRLVKTLKTADASCVNGWLHKAVETRGHRCFAACGKNSTNDDSDCWLRCFYSTMLGKLWPQGSRSTAEPMSQAAILAPFWHALKPDGGACPALSPYVPPHV
jgi:hypothetical protein